jgi:hypothetical protein
VPLMYHHRNSDVVGLDLGRDRGQDQIPEQWNHSALQTTGLCILRSQVGTNPVESLPLPESN